MKTLNARSLSDYVGMVYRFKWRVLTVMAAAVLLAAGYLAITPKQYDSNAKLFMRVGRENAALDPTLMGEPTIALNASRKAEMNSIVEHLRSRSILEKVLAIVEPEQRNAPPTKKEARLQALNRKLYVHSPRESAVVAIQGSAKEPHKAQQMVASLIDIYLDEHMRINRPTGSYEFFDEQAKLLKEQLGEAQTALRDAKNRAGMASIEGRRTGLEEQISALEARVHQVDAELAGSEAKIRALQASGDSVSAPLLRQMVAGTPSDGLATMREELFRLRIQEQEVLSKYTDAHPVTITIRQQVREVEDALKEKEPDRQQLMSALSAPEVANRASLAVQKEKLHSQLAELNAKLRTLNEDEIVVEERRRKVQQLEAKYLSYVENLEEARMDQALRTDRISNVSILQPATFEPKPVRPSKARVLLLALFGGLVGGLVVAFVSEQLDPDTQPLEASAVTAAAQVPAEPADDDTFPMPQRTPVGVGADGTANVTGNGNGKSNGEYPRGERS